MDNNNDALHHHPFPPKALFMLHFRANSPARHDGMVTDTFSGVLVLLLLVAALGRPIRKSEAGGGGRPEVWEPELKPVRNLFRFLFAGLRGGGGGGGAL